VARRVAIVGAGWAGLAAAVAATQAGHAVTLFEAARVAGGRARTLPLQLPDGTTALVDNGQHILVGAYVETLRLMEQVGVDPARVLLRLPLVLRDPAGRGLALPDWPAPWDAAAGILRAQGWSWGDKWSLLRASAAWRRNDFACAPQDTVADLARRLTPRVRAELIEPLCVAALNTPAERASGTVFLRVLRDALFGQGWNGWGGSNLLLPRQDLGALFPHAAVHWLQAHGAHVKLGARAEQLARSGHAWKLDGTPYDAVVLATPAAESARLLRASGIGATDWLAAVDALAYEPIATVYATGGPRLALPMLALPTGPAQFVFDRGQLGGSAGLLAFVVSASHGDRDGIESAVRDQAAAFGWNVQPVQTVVEKRATFACVPALRRPPVAIAPNLWACGDYVEGPYPATLEGAVRAGLQVARQLA
jgi:squalene-associated FAD-dependent desaturase